MSKFNVKDLVLCVTNVWGCSFYRIFPVTTVTDKYLVVNDGKFDLKGKSIKGNSVIKPLTSSNYKIYLENEIKGRVLDLYSIPASQANKSLITIDKSLELSLQASKHILDKIPNEKSKIVLLLRFLESYNKISTLNDNDIVDKNLIVYY